MKKENSTNLQKYSGIAEQMLKLFSKHPEIAKVLFDIIIYGDEGEGNRISTTNKYEYKGNVYNYVGVGKFKDSTGKWIDAIIYERDNHMYMREVTDFIDKFKKA